MTFYRNHSSSFRAIGACIVALVSLLGNATGAQQLDLRNIKHCPGILAPSVELTNRPDAVTYGTVYTSSKRKYAIFDPLGKWNIERNNFKQSLKQTVIFSVGTMMGYFATRFLGDCYNASRNFAVKRELGDLYARTGG